MDPFQLLPPELRVEILTHVRSHRRISQLILASPAMFQQFHESRYYITRRLIARDMDEEMIQDATAIIQFPSWKYSDDYRSAAQEHMTLWASQKLPNPLKTRDRKLMGELIQLHSRVMLFIEDYLTKATAVYPPREYLCLSPLQANQGHLWFKGEKICPRFDEADLTEIERRRILRAFLRYELICRDGYSRGMDYSHGIYWDQITSMKGRIRQEFSPLFRKAMEDYKAKRIEAEALSCVHEYLKSLYGAIFAQWADSWLPEIPVDPFNSSSNGLIYPDNLYFHSDVYAADLGLESFYTRGPTESSPEVGSRDRYDWRHNRIPSDLKCREHVGEGLPCHSYAQTAALFGLDIAAEFLRYFFRGSRPFVSDLKGWYQGLEHAAWSHYWEGSCIGIGEWKGCSLEDTPICPQIRQRAESISGQRVLIYRQRAWVFFENSRLYPSSRAEPHLPTDDEVKEYYWTRQDAWDDEATFDDGVRGPFRTSSLRRSLRWHRKYRDSKIQEFPAWNKDNGFREYSFLFKAAYLSRYPIDGIPQDIARFWK